MTGEMTELEKEMLAQGLASARMVAKKIKMDAKSVLRHIRTGKLKSEEVRGLKFISIASVKEFAGPSAVERLRLDDWSDVP
jgi:hypothetical protein